MLFLFLDGIKFLKKQIMTLNENWIFDKNMEYKGFWDNRNELPLSS